MNNLDTLLKSLEYMKVAQATDYEAGIVLSCIQRVKDHTAGMALVPIEPTGDMLDEGYACMLNEWPDLEVFGSDVLNIYKAMITNRGEPGDE